MKPFPEEWELLSLFESEPRLLDSGVPWEYNNLTFETIRDRDRIVCVIEPGYERMEFTWWHNQNKHLALVLHWVSGLRVVTEGGSDQLLVSFRDQHLLQLRLHLKPEIRCEWGTTRDFP